MLKKISVDFDSPDTKFDFNQQFKPLDQSNRNAKQADCNENLINLKSLVQRYDKC